MPRKVMLSTSNRPQLIIETSHSGDDNGEAGDDVHGDADKVTRIRKVNMYMMIIIIAAHLKDVAPDIQKFSW